MGTLAVLAGWDAPHLALGWDEYPLDALTTPTVLGAAALAVLVLIGRELARASGAGPPWPRPPGTLFWLGPRRPTSASARGGRRDPGATCRTGCACNTPKDAILVTPPQEAGFRVFSERTVVGEWKDGTQQYFDEQFASEWAARMEALGPEGYVRLTDEQLTADRAPLRRLLRGAAAAPAAVPASKSNTGTTITRVYGVPPSAADSRPSTRDPASRRAVEARRARAGRPSWPPSLAVAVRVARPPPGRSCASTSGGLTGDFLGDGWSESDRTDLEPDVGALDPSAAGFSRFRFRAARPAAEIDLPVAAREGPLRLTLRAMARVRTAVSFHVGGEPAGEIVIPRGPWGRHDVELPASRRGRAATPRSPCGRCPWSASPTSSWQQPVVWIAEIEAGAPARPRFSPSARVLLAAVAARRLRLRAGRRRRGTAAALAAPGPRSARWPWLAHLAPLPLFVGLTRLCPFALAGGLLTRLALGAWRHTPPPARAGAVRAGGGGILFHGALPFVPGFDPYDVEVHVRRVPGPRPRAPRVRRAPPLRLAPADGDADLRHRHRRARARRRSSRIRPCPTSPSTRFTGWASTSTGG